MSAGLTPRITLCGILVATGILRSSCALAAEPVGNASSEKPLQVETGATTHIPVKTDKGTPSVEQIVQYASTHALASWDGASAPLGRIVLMRRGTNLCAVRFTKFHRGEDTPPGVLTRGGPSLYAEYDWYDLTGPQVVSGHRKLSNVAGSGIPFLFPIFTGEHFIKCSSFEPLWRYPTVVTLFESNDPHDYGIELAPTAWRDVAEIEMNHPRLSWYRYDEKRKPILIPLGELPPAKGQ